MNRITIRKIPVFYSATFKSQLCLLDLLNLHKTLTQVKVDIKKLNKENRKLIEIFLIFLCRFEVNHVSKTSTLQKFLVCHMFQQGFSRQFLKR